MTSTPMLPAPEIGDTRPVSPTAPGATVPDRPGGWWHDYVCPVHGVELTQRIGDTHLGPCGCRLRGEKYTGGWLALEHQAQSRRARVLARRFRATGDTADRDAAIELVESYARVYVRIAADGWSAQSESWMLRGKLFAQALSEAQWAVGIADAALVLAGAWTPSSHVQEMFGHLAETFVDARRTLVVDRDDQRNNYTAWLDAAYRLVTLAQTTWDDHCFPAPIDDVASHMRMAVMPDGWEWEASTYYHVFVLRGYLLALRGTDPAALPDDVVDTLRRMIDVLTVIAAPDGYLPALHDGPYDRVHMHREVLEICVLASGLFAETGLDRIEDWARARLGAGHDGLEDLLDGWFRGTPVAAPPARRGPHRFDDAGFVVLTDDVIHAVLDAGPHGGAHGHLDKLGLYLYGRDARWQPAPGVPPYASPLRRGHYARTVAHPTVRVDGEDQCEATATVTAWDAASCTVVGMTEDAVPGVVLSRAVSLRDGLLIDLVRARTADGASRAITLGFRPGVPLTVSMDETVASSQWRGEAATLHGSHAASLAEATLVSLPGRGPSDRPAVPATIADWSVEAADVSFLSVYRAGAPVRLRDVRFTEAGAVFRCEGDPDTDYEVRL
ncbi:heparinase II/III family protein [Microbacterium sp. SSW1-59]|uniref:heparinase II/III domain-containing protein n=1 Tax=Microbacterium xanthum TaxID=3079794 RepID=UPI002AD2791A|nr:heparinase II/III family protein [Microbacterium sp. SSW1-59]MDZ8200376.1 heparinase II/III family protein [Microbacterium sp. SSW1-59]